MNAHLIHDPRLPRARLLSRVIFLLALTFLGASPGFAAPSEEPPTAKTSTLADPITPKQPATTHFQVSPRGKEIHVIADNLSAHKTGQVKELLESHPKVHMHFTPTYSSWLNQVELWFSKVERDVIARGVFTSVPDLKRKLMRYIREYNKTPKTVKWKYFDPKRRITPTSAVTAH